MFSSITLASPETQVFEENEVEIELGRIFSMRTSSKDEYRDWIAFVAELKFYGESSAKGTARDKLIQPLKKVKRIEVLMPKNICIDFLRDAFVANDSKTRIKLFQVKKEFLLEVKDSKKYQAFLKLSSLDLKGKDLKDKRASCEIMRD